MADSALAVFSPSRFLRDVQKTCTALNAPYSESTVLAVLKAYNQSFVDGAVLWRTSDRPGDDLNFRFYERRPVDCITSAVTAGFLKADNPLGNLITSWSSLYDGTPEQSCDFSVHTGLQKTWLYLGGMRPIDYLLRARDVPESIRSLGPTFQGLGLNFVRHVAVDFHSNTMNIYFRAPSPITEEQTAKLVALAGSPPPSQVEFQRMRELLNPKGFTFSVTAEVATGAVKRVAFYAQKLPPGEHTEFGERLVTFFKDAPSYDEEELNAVAFSFGNGGKKYLKAERSYCGRVALLLREHWKSPLTDGELEVEPA